MPDLNIAFISLGSNIQPAHNLARAVSLLRQQADVLAVSHAYRTPPQGFHDQADFLNCAVQLRTPLTPFALKHEVLAQIERELKRVRDPNNKNAPRTIDLDISLWNNDILDYGEKPWHIPDSDILRFAHVAVPLAEIAPDYLHPLDGHTLAHIAARFADAHFEKIPLPLT